MQQGTWNAEGRINTPEEFVLVVQGPRSLHVMEKVTGESLRDIKFSYTRMTQIAAQGGGEPLEANGGTFFLDLPEMKDTLYYEQKWRDPDGIIFDISHQGWVGTSE